MPLDFYTMKVEQVAMIKLFGTKSVNEIESSSGSIKEIFNGTPGISDSTSILKLKGYNEFYSKLRECKIQVENIFANTNTNEQVKNCLNYIDALKKETIDTKEKREIFKSLIQAALDANLIWKDQVDLPAKYKAGVEMIEEWVDFFLSYTNRDQPSLNNNYFPELERQYKRKVWNDEVDENNMLAKLIVKNLKYYNNLNAFFDKESMVCGEKIANEVFRYCEKTFAFAQLIEPMAFSTQAGKTNWCFEEYAHFKKKNDQNQKKVFFFQTNILPGAIPNPYKDWHTDFSDSLKVIIDKPLDNEELIKKCNQIAETILTNKNTTIQNFINAL